MAIQTVDLTVPNGDTPRSANTKINANFSNATHAASRLVGTSAGNVLLVGAFGLGAPSTKLVDPAAADMRTLKSGIFLMGREDSRLPATYNTWGQSVGILLQVSEYGGSAIFTPAYSDANQTYTIRTYSGTSTKDTVLRTDRNTTVDGNGFLKGASPVVDLYNESIEMNDDAKQQNITFEKVSTGNYLVKGSLGFAQEGWYIETPKDANGNVLVAVTYEQLANNDISVKTYAKKFDDETGDIVANLAKPRDIPAGRFISLRLHELPSEPASAPAPSPEK